MDRDLKALEAKRDHLHKRHAKARAAAELKVEQTREAHDAALADWEA